MPARGGEERGMGGLAMGEAWKVHEEREPAGFVEPAVNIPIYVDGMAFAKLRDGMYHIAAYVEQEGPNGVERVINLRFIAPLGGVMNAIPVLLGLREVMVRFLDA